MNTNSNLDPQDPIHSLARVLVEELAREQRLDDEELREVSEGVLSGSLAHYSHPVGCQCDSCVLRRDNARLDVELCNCDACQHGDGH